MAKHRTSIVARSVALLLWLACLVHTSYLHAQTDARLEEQKQQVEKLVREIKYTEALPLLEKIIAVEPNNAQMHFYLGFALLAQALTEKSPAAQKTLRTGARAAFVKSKELGNPEPLVDALIQGIPADGSLGQDFSPNIEANRIMSEAEAAFAQGRLDEALKDYQKALEHDPRLYHAALFSGDVFSQKGNFEQAEIWYQKAIAIDPTRETAYRYSATPLMKQKKYDQARDRYIEAFIVEPYSRFARAGLVQWAQVTKTTLAHPRIDIPTDVTFDEKGDARINLDASTLLNGKDDGSFFWISYGSTRSLWHKEKFARTFPNEKSYRHSLAEEADALRSVLAPASSELKTRKLSPSLARLKNLDEEGLLEAYILLARTDAGIAQDYPAYLKNNREKLRRYVVSYVVTGGGASPR